MVETVLRTIQSELIWPIARQTLQQTENAIGRRVDGVDTPVRRRSSLGFLSPIAFERRVRDVS
ncbi:MAG: hypothetical protein AB7S99_09615 [Pseudodonghicola sp.]